MANSKLRIIYRSNSHAPLWLVAKKSGVWEKNGLTVDTSPELVREKAVEALKNGHVDLISGNHHNLFVRNAKNGEDFVHLAQAKMPAMNWKHAIILGVVLSSAAVIGDLIESLFKREAGVKDSGNGVTLSALGFDHLTRPKSIHFRLAL